MIVIADIINKISIRFKHWMTEENWPIWLWMTDADSNCTPVALSKDPVMKNSYLSFGSFAYFTAEFFI